MRPCLFTFGFFLFAAFTAAAQEIKSYESLVSKADLLYLDEHYHLAAEYYKDALKLNIEDPSIDYKLAECYRKSHNYFEAEAYYLKVFYTGASEFPLALFHYAHMLKLNGNHLESAKRFNQFVAFHEENALMKDYVEQAIVEQSGSEMALQNQATPVIARAEPLGSDVNSVYNDFGPSVHGDNSLAITSTRPISNRALIDDRTGEAFADVYYFEKTGELWVDKTRPSLSRINSVYHDASGSFTKDGRKFYFTVCEERCRIFESSIDNGKWSKPLLLPEEINRSGSDSKQPAISPSGNELYFVSDRPGGEGQLDIWISKRDTSGNWSEPVNAGKTINTKNNDFAPSVSPEGLLFFASDGHPGYGGADLFLCQRSAEGENLIYNLNAPFNSVRDDCFMAFSNNGIFWSSNRDGGLGGFDVYVGKTSAKSLLAKLDARKKNASREALLTSRTANAESIHLLASRNEETIDYNSLTYEKRSIVNAMVEKRLKNVQDKPENYGGLTRDEYEVLNAISKDRVENILINQRYSSNLVTEVQEVTAEYTILTGELVDSKTGRTFNHARVLLTNSQGEVLKITRTNSNGSFRFSDIPAGQRLFLRMETMPGESISPDIKNLAHARPSKLPSSNIENIFFDFDHYSIRPEAAQALSELASYLKSHPAAQVEILAFADDRGSYPYNFELTQKRGDAVAAYLISQGVDQTSLMITPKGKASAKDDITEAQRQYNRRVEFFISGASSLETSVKTYIVKKEADWELIAKWTGTSEEELKALNNAESEIVRAYQPIRLPLEVEFVSEDLFFQGI